METLQTIFLPCSTCFSASFYKQFLGYPRALYPKFRDQFIIFPFEIHPQDDVLLKKIAEVSIQVFLHGFEE